MGVTRRTLLGVVVFAPLASLRAEQSDGPATCYDPAKLPISQRGMRRSLGFKDVSDSPTRTCSACAFFTRKEGNCGTCQLLIGGSVSAGSVCNSWARKG